jgi:hypothetical protein
MKHTAKGVAMETVRRYSMFIGGDWVDADERFEIRSPATEELVASVAKGGRGHIGTCCHGVLSRCLRCRRHRGNSPFRGNNPCCEQGLFPRKA